MNSFHPDSVSYFVVAFLANVSCDAVKFAALVEMLATISHVDQDSVMSIVYGLCAVWKIPIPVRSYCYQLMTFYCMGSDLVNSAIGFSVDSCIVH